MKRLKLANGAAITRSTTEKKVGLIAHLLTVILMTFALPLTASAAGTTNFVPFADQSTVALWLFDDRPYPHAIITDASQNEYDLILMDGTLEAGKFGNALAASSSGNY
ncbi:MAG: hypothetical protein U1F76_12995 [Candidatus Competibacteraceae bacterium]